MIEFTAVILAASLGDRLFPLTGGGGGGGGGGVDDGHDNDDNDNDDYATTPSRITTRSRPKHMLPICGEPILGRLVHTLRESGFERCIILAGCGMAQDIRTLVSEYLRDGQCNAMKIDVYELPGNSAGSADALRYLHENHAASLEHIVVMPGDLVIEGKGIFGWLVDAHRRRYSCLMGTDDEEVACTMLLSDVGETEEDGVTPMKESAKGKKGGFVREEEEIDYIGLTDVALSSSVNDKELKRVIFKTSKLDVEEDEDFVGKIPKLTISKLKIMSSCSGLKVRTDLLDLHVYVLSPWVRKLLVHRRNIMSLQEDLIPLLIDRQFRGKSSVFGNGCDGIGPDSDDTSKFLVGAQILPRGSRIALRSCTVPSFLFICREAVSHYVNIPEKAISPGYSGTFTASLTSSFKNVDGEVQAKGNVILLKGAVVPKKVTIKNSTIGRRGKIGEKCKLNNVVVMDDVTIGNETILQNTVIGEGAVIGDNCNLNDCQVAQKAIVRALTKLKGDAIVVE